MKIKRPAQFARKWSVEELGAFYVGHRSSLLNRARRSLGDSHKAEEVVQEAILRLVVAAPELESSEHALAYLSTTVDNLCRDVFRSEGRRPKLVSLDLDASEPDAALVEVRDHAEIVAAADDAAIVRQALSLLSASERAALVMWEIEGRSTQEIARELGVKESTVRYTVSRARSSMKRILSELIIDEQRGLTALDLLSNSYRKASKLAKDGSRIALSIFLMIFAYLGFSNLTDRPSLRSSELSVDKPMSSPIGSEISPSMPSLKISSSKEKSSLPSVVKAVSPKASIATSNARASLLSFPGLDKNGIPTGFTVADSSGKQGALYFSGKEAVVGDAGITLTSIVKTSTTAANIFLTQNIIQDVTGVTFDGNLSYGREGRWVPLATKVLSTEMERQASGNYLLTAVIQVKSEVDSTIVIPAYAAGRDLEVSPSRLVTRVLLNPAKTQILGQAVLVVERPKES